MGKLDFKPGNMLYPLPAVMVSVRDKEGNDNIITVAWTGTVCTNPPMLYISVRPERHSYKALHETGEFVVNLTTEKIAKATDFCGVRSGRDMDKFEQTGLIKGEAKKINAPVIEDSPVNIECRVREEVPLGSHTMFIGEITDMEVLSEVPSVTYEYYLNNIKPKPQAVDITEEGQTVWRCTICGYEYVGEELPEDFVCPLCKHPASDFEKIVKKVE